jgi:hypothetical protein
MLLSDKEDSPTTLQQTPPNKSGLKKNNLGLPRRDAVYIGRKKKCLANRQMHTANATP